MEKFVIIDGNSLINRAFYALPPLTSLSGKPCNAVYGFVNMFLNVISKVKPKYLAVVFDAGKHTFRHDIYADYKGKRDKMPEDLATQLPMLKEVLSAMNIKILEMPEIEADDIIGTLSKRFDEHCILVSGDKDLLQLISKNTHVWLTRKGISEVLEVDEKVLKQEFGITPEQVIDMKALMGDSSDNIPGVPGIGKVGAAKLIETYGSVEKLYDNIGEIGGKLQEKLLNGNESCFMSKTLATIKLDVDISCDLDECEYSLPFGAEAVELLRELDFKSILNRKELFVIVPKNMAQDFSSKVEGSSVEIEDETTFDLMISKIDGSFAITFSDLTYNFAIGDIEYVIYKSGDLFVHVIPKFKSIFENNNIHKVCFDAKSLMHDFASYNIRLVNFFDLSLAIYIANEMDGELSLTDALKMNGISSEFQALALKKLKEIYITKLINNMQLKLFSDVELPLVNVLFYMERAGIKVDVEQIKSLSMGYKAELKELTDKIYSLAGEEFNINSPKQLGAILFDKLHIENKKKDSTSIEVLTAIEGKHEIVGYIIRYRKINKLIGTYLDGMLSFVSVDGKIHTTFMQRATSTGRLSSREPNLQNLPIRDDEGRALRKMFSSSFEGGEMVSADYNQIELRLMANFSGDENMITDYLHGSDIHTATAGKVFDVLPEQVTPNMRRTAKAVNFGIIYGISGFGLSQNIGSTQKEAIAFINKYMEIYPRVKLYGNKCIEDARNKGYVSTIMGRVRHLNDINSSNHVVRSAAERMAKNMPLQGSASDIIKIAMIKVFNAFEKENLKSKLVIQIHDELVVDCYPGEREMVERILKREMESVVNLTVPLLVDISHGKTLYETK